MALYDKSAIQRLSETSDGMEIWWDSSPLIFKAWSKKMIDKASDEEREHLKEQLKTLFDEENPGDTFGMNPKN